MSYRPWDHEESDMTEQLTLLLLLLWLFSGCWKFLGSRTMRTLALLFLKKKNSIYLLFLAVLGLCCHMGFSPVDESWSYFLVAVCRLLNVVASLDLEQGL